MKKLILVAAIFLAGCGVDGEPVQPSMNVGIGVGSGGVNTYGGVGLHQGPLSIYLGF
ncbi:hypothetical protein [Sedimentitalea arenosa]|uniref:Lipoprotein n=1 Tax=Sedimentitalea arenosa TaxID=2798803 RepID=A0A8J7IJZ5_9RHOB|nr:hypothetical protein [Arenibacterium arenosum]MBJ6373037.1 hypothetical protein [Arenibacterium arenosum]